jgi:hypothetical protein
MALEFYNAYALAWDKPLERIPENLLTCAFKRLLVAAFASMIVLKC